MNAEKGYFSDLDQTLIYSQKAFETNLTLPEKVGKGLVGVELYNGKLISLTTYQAHKNLIRISEQVEFVPVTTRTRSQYERICFPDVRIQYAITGNGGNILVDGVEDFEWKKYLVSEVFTLSTPLAEVHAYFEENWVSTPWMKSHKIADGLFHFSIVEREDVPASYLSELKALAKGWNYKLSLQGRKLYLIPAGLSKGAALEEVRNRLGLTEVYTSGDSLLDKSLFKKSTLSWRPAHGELHREGYTADNLIVTKAAHILAGEEITAEVLKIIT